MDAHRFVRTSKTMFQKTNLAFGFVHFMNVLMTVRAANILYLCGVASPSHHIWNSVFVNGLAARGHNLTVISADHEKSPPNGVHYIHMNGLYNKMYDEIIKSAFQPHESNPIETSTLNTGFHNAKVCNLFNNLALKFNKLLNEEDLVKSDGFRALSSYPDDFRFDLIIIDMTTGWSLLGFVHKFKYPPLMTVTPFGHLPHLNAFVGGHHYYSYIPHYNLPYSQKMNFFQRFYNLIFLIQESIEWERSWNKDIDKLVEGKFGPDMPSISEIEKRTAIALVSTHPIFDYSRPLPENVIPVGGLHIRDAKPVPKDLNDFIESSKKGAILFTFGTNFNASYMSFEKRKAFVDAFKRFPDYHFIWKFETQLTDMELPKNVLIRPWLPQSDILAQPKIKAFITHGGLLGTFEALWRGVPMIGIPFAHDQPTNIMKSIEIGIAEKLDYHTMTMEIITDTLQKVLENPKYLENAQKISARFQDQKEKPLDRAVWWAEWLIRNPDCEYLKSPVLRLGFIVGNSYDVLASIFFGLFLISFAVIKLGLLVTNAFLCTSTKRNKQIKYKKID